MLQLSPPLPALGTLIDSIDERARAIESKRVYYGGQVAATIPSGDIPTSSGTWISPTGMPSVTIQAGVTGIVVVLVSAYTDDTQPLPPTPMQMGVSINGGGVQLVGDTAGGIAAFNGLLLTGAAGFIVDPNSDATFLTYVRNLSAFPEALNVPGLAVIPF